MPLYYQFKEVSKCSLEEKLSRRCQGCLKYFQKDDDMGRIKTPFTLPLYFHYACAIQAVRDNLPASEQVMGMYLAIWFRDSAKRENAEWS